jgi:GT2 family glycosyltransferase
MHSGHCHLNTAIENSAGAGIPGVEPRLPEVLVGISTQNRAKILQKAICSALAQSYSQIRVAVLDDGSEDETPALRANFPAVEWQRWSPGRGLIVARNEIMRTATEYYLSLDDDAWFVAGDEIEIAVQHLENNPRVGAVAFDILSPDRAQPAYRSRPCSVHMFVGCGHVLRMRAVKDVGYYPMGPGLYGSEEKDLCLRLLNRGWEVDILPGVHVWHDRTTIARDPNGQHCSGVCNDLAFALRRCPIPLVLGILPLKLLSHLRFSVRRRLLRPCMAGIGTFLRYTPVAWRNRDPVHTSTFLKFIWRSRRAL